ncbi:MAG: LuxR C-terminal-related transcriptional regulator [Acidobacteriota bacterium]|jgi:PAS domain S-box-containing protein
MADPHQHPLPPHHRDLVHIIETMNCGLSASDLDGNLRYANPRLLTWLRYSWDEVIGRPATELGVPEHADLMRSEMRSVHSGDLRVRLMVARRKDSTTFPALVIPQRLLGEDGELQGTFSIIIDLGAVQTAKRVGLDNESPLVTSAMLEIVHQLDTLRQASGSTPPAFDRNHPSLAELTPRELEVLEHLLVGERVSVIAANLFISEHTVRNHLKSIFKKTGTGSQAELVPWVRSLE